MSVKTETKPATPRIDNTQLYENIGNIVIERAVCGDEECLDIYERAAKMAQGMAK